MVKIFQVFVIQFKVQNCLFFQPADCDTNEGQCGMAVYAMKYCNEAKLLFDDYNKRCSDLGDVTMNEVLRPKKEKGKHHLKSSKALWEEFFG